MQIVKRYEVTGGYTNADRAVVELADGRRGFLKRGTDDYTREQIRRELRVYHAFQGQSFLPNLLDGDDGLEPFLLLPDLRQGHWPPPWRVGDLDALTKTLGVLHGTIPPPFLQQIPWQDLCGWHLVAENPAPFLGLGWCTKRWLDQHLQRLIELEATEPDEPCGIIHNDIRGDNICFTDDGLKLIDWNHAGLGPVHSDRAFAAMTIVREGGPRPEAWVTTDPIWAARVSGLFASRAGLPFLPHAPRVRWIQQFQLVPALEWIHRVVGVEMPDGPRWSERP